MNKIFPLLLSSCIGVAGFVFDSDSFAAQPNKPKDKPKKVSDKDPKLPSTGSGPAAAREDLKHFTFAPGLGATLFASEPMLKNPTDMDVDARGRIWITEGVNYRASIKSWGILEPKGD